MSFTLLITARKHFLKLYGSKVPTQQLYRTMLEDKYIFSEKQLCQDSISERLLKFIFVAASLERRQQGNAAKIASANCLKVIKKNATQGDVSSSIQLLLGMSNVLLWDQDIIEHQLQYIKQYRRHLTNKQIYSIYHSLYKLNHFNQEWSDFFHHSFRENINQLSIADQIPLLYVSSNLYYMDRCNTDDLHHYVNSFSGKLKSTNIFNSKFVFQFVQVIYNLYPELITGSDVKDENKFKDLYEKIYDRYLLCKTLVDLKSHSRSIDYFEQPYSFNVIRIKGEPQPIEIDYENGVEQILQILKVPYERSKRMAIYDVDFLVDNNIVLNCNGPVHFIEDLDGNVLSASPNHLMQQRHLKQLNLKKIIELDYYSWGKIDIKEKKIEHLKQLLQQ